jgi:23S rRNA (adenine2030-N6)-methyltransferase
MLSYQHEYHCGNHADVLKHAVLACALGALGKKPAPLRVLDGFAGSGTYDLFGPEASRHAEYKSGIARLLAAAERPGGAPAALAPYLDAVRAMNPEGRLRYYPGSPALSLALLRPGDTVELLEQHPRSLRMLRAAVRGDRRAHVHDRDAYEGLPALVPPRERRGLVLIDPSYEVKDEFKRVAELLLACHRRWPQGVYAIWYPLIRDPQAERFVGRIAATGVRRIWQAELAVGPKRAQGLWGSGMLVVNPPFGMDEVLGPVMGCLHAVLAGEDAALPVARWLVPE